jgi:hypothetical protein
LNPLICFILGRAEAVGAKGIVASMGDLNKWTDSRPILSTT